MYDPYAEFETHVMPNGLTVHALEMKGKPWQYMGFIIHAGSRHDAPGKAGLAHFAEHLVGEHMVPNVPINKKGDFFKLHGGFANFGATGYESTVYSFKLPAIKEFITEGLSIFARGIFPEKVVHGLEKERKIIKAEYLRKFSTPFSRELFYLPLKNLFKGHDRSEFDGNLGTLDTIEKLTLEDLQSFFDTFYVPNNIEIVTVGGMPVSEINSVIAETRFSSNKNGSRTKITEFFTDIALPINPVVTIKRPLVEGQGGNMSSYKSSVLLPGTLYPNKSGMLRDLISDIINEELRENLQLTYQVSVINQGFSDVYQLIIEVEFEYDEAITRLIDGFISHLPEKIQNEEKCFNQLKHSRLARYKLTDESNSDIFRNSMQSVENYRLIDTDQELLRRVQELNFKDIIDLSQYLSVERRFTQIITP